MSPVVCEGLQLCLVEPLVLHPKLSPPNSNFSQSSPYPKGQKDEEKNSEDDDTENNSNNGELGGWNFIQALTNSSQNYKKVFFDDTQKVYVHPLDKKSLSTLSSKSLEMCTEALGCETGSDISESSDEFSSSLSWGRDKMERSKCKNFSKKVSQSCSFPPPLTSISGSDGVQVRPRREGGRLVLQAVKVSSHSSCFHADRTDGRLRLSLVDCCVNKVNAKEGDEEENDSVVEVEEEDEEEEGQLYDEGDDSECGEEEEEDDHSEDGCWVGDMEGNTGKVGCENGMGELLRPSWCKEGMPIWGQFRVAIS